MLVQFKEELGKVVKKIGTFNIEMNEKIDAVLSRLKYEIIEEDMVRVEKDKKNILTGISETQKSIESMKGEIEIHERSLNENTREYQEGILGKINKLRKEMNGRFNSSADFIETCQQNIENDLAIRISNVENDILENNNKLMKIMSDNAERDGSQAD
jgi:hypothetical protein